MAATLPDRIREARKAAGLTQIELAERAETTQGTVSAWETGARRPTVDALPALARALGVSADWLLGITEEDV